ncbi:MAG: molecular chaperone HscC [Clostridiales Family XIII bacterium]|jgi:molecular chaperone HscC|nr:molecular chaperone HscC [Clostridiales Family XIII bacterium]
MPIIGIDLGTTNSLAAYFTSDGPKIIPNSLGEALTPSVVSVGEDGTIYVGRIAKERLLTCPENTASVFKRSMGSEKTFTLGDRVFSAEELSSFIIKKLKEDAENFLGEEISEAVISTPAYFNDTQRKATKAAGELAGFRVERIISEPTAAAIAFGLHTSRDISKCLVFDLGGGTFDVSILEFSDKVMEVRAVAGDNYLGGEDFTGVLMEMFMQEHGISPETLTLRDFVMLNKNAEDAKLELSARKKATMSWTFDGQARSLEVTAEVFEERCKTLIARLKAPIIRAVNDAGVRLADVDSIIFVGGATKMPLIQSFVSRLFKRFPVFGINPDEAVALGAAVQAAMKERKEDIRELILTDVCPFTLGTAVSVQQNNGFFRSGIFQPIIERNTVIPASREERFYTMAPNQTSVKVEILQGESWRAKDNVLLGEIDIPVPAGPAGQETVDVRYTYDVNGILEVNVKVTSSGESKRMIIEKNPGAVTPEQIEQRIEELASLKLHPRDKDKNRYLLEKGERYYQTTTGFIRMRIAEELNNFEAALDGQHSKEIEEAAERLRSLFEDAENEQNNGE